MTFEREKNNFYLWAESSSVAMETARGKRKMTGWGGIWMWSQDVLWRREGGGGPIHYLILDPASTSPLTHSRPHTGQNRYTRGVLAP